MSDGPTKLHEAAEPRSRYTSTRGINRDSLPWRLWVKAKKNFWDPSDIDYSQDVVNWAGFSEELRRMVAAGARGFMVGEEAVTLDILPLLRAISDDGRLEESIFLTSFALEEAKHVDFFRTWFDTVGFDPSVLDDVGGSYGDEQDGRRNGRGGGGGVFEGELRRVMTRLDTDRSPQAFLDVGLTYNQFVEGVLAISGYKGWGNFFKANPGLPGFQKGLSLVQRDERRHIAYGTFLCRRLIAANPDLWGFVEKRWEELTRPVLEARKEAIARGETRGTGRYLTALINRRLEVMAVARTMSVEEVEGGSLDELEATNELAPQPAG